MHSSSIDLEPKQHCDNALATFDAWAKVAAEITRSVVSFACSFTNKLTWQMSVMLLNHYRHFSFITKVGSQIHIHRLSIESIRSGEPIPRAST